MISDGELVRQTLAGKTAAYEELVRRWASKVAAVCHAKTGRRSAVEDLAQETLVRGFRALPTLSDPEKFGAWIRGIAIRTCLDWLKSKQRTQVDFASLGEEQSPEHWAQEVSFSESIERKEELDRLMTQVEVLDPIYRETLMLFYYEEMDYKQIAELLGVSTAAINARLTKARAMLRERLRCEDEM